MTPTGEPRRGRWAFRAAVALYVVSFFLPVYGVFIGQPPHYGYEVFWDFRPNPAEWFDRPTAATSIANLTLAWVEDVRVLSAAMLLLGGSWISAQSTLQVTTQLSLPSWVRARGLAVFIAVFMGVLAFGAPTWGKLAELTSLHVALSAAAGAGLLGLLLTWPLSAGLDRSTSTR